MKGNERAIIAGAIVAVLGIAFYMVVLSPKRAEVSELDAEVTSLEASISEQDQLISFGEQARKEFPRDYGRLVVLGKAVPEQADTASLLVSLDSMAVSSDVDFRGIVLGQGTGDAAAAAPTPTPAPVEGAEGSAPATETTGTDPATATTAAPAPATEAGAANLPIGAVVGPAGLPTLPYDLTFTGGFFDIADYIGRIDRLVEFDDKSGEVDVSGRLMTVDGFAMKGGQDGPNPTLDVNFVLTSYVTPSTQGTTAGATPGGPAPAGVPEATPASSTVAP